LTRRGVDDRAKTLYGDPTCANIMGGMAFHWYEQMMATFNVNSTYWLNPSKILLATEGCNCPGVSPGDWGRAEHYGRDVLADLMNWAQGWVDWNLVLDSIGGPNHVHNYCDAMIIANHKNQTILVQPSYYYMGQISKYLVPGSVRISSTLNIALPANVTSVAPLASGDNVILWQCNGSPTQRWVVPAAGSAGNISVLGSNLCLAASVTNSVDSGENAQLSVCGNTPSQTWSVPANDTVGSIVTKLDSTCLEVAGSSLQNSANAQQANCTSGLNQRWLFNSTDSTIRSQLQPNMCLTAGWSPVNAQAFRRPDGKIVLIVMNESNVPISFKVRDVTSTVKAFATSIPPHAIQTYLY